jgi:hypothetical protein
VQRRPLLIFLLASLALCAVVFRGGLWGASLIAPLDIAPAIFTKYQFMDPGAHGLFENQFIIDQLTYDLPLQNTIYAAYRRGEMPWWDPYTSGGRPLLADAHINGTDPVRVATYFSLPFATAYNWTIIAHFLLGGLGMFWLLRHLAFAPWLCVALGLTYQFAGCHTLFIAHPWIQGSFLYYPFLWLVWDAALTRSRWWHPLGAALCVAGVLYAGNLQSHAYLALFAGALGCGYGGRSWAKWRRVLAVMLPGLVLGAGLAAPVLGNELELFVHSARAVVSSNGKLAWLAGPASLAAVYPWSLGTFRTLDLARVFGPHSNLGFYLFIGSAGFVLALLGAVGGDVSGPRRSLRCTALWLVGFYLVILSTPLQMLLYPRSAGLGVIGLILLAALGVERLANANESFPRWGWTTLGLTAGIVLALHVGSLVVYPRFMPKVREMVRRELGKSNTGMYAARALREAQIQNLPREVTFMNPGAALGAVSLAALGWLLLRPKLRRRPLALPVLLALNFLPVLLFCRAFVPVHPMQLWERLAIGGPEQQRVAAALVPAHGRLFDSAPARFDQLLPDTFGHLYRVRTTHGYAALQPRNLAVLPLTNDALRLPIADYIYRSIETGQATGTLERGATPIPVRFQWASSSPRSLEVISEQLGEIQLRVGAGESAELRWNDTHYPGWRATSAGQTLAIEPAPPCFNRLAIPAGARIVVLRYEPTYLRTDLWLAAIALLSLAWISIALLVRPTPSHQPESTP